MNSTRLIFIEGETESQEGSATSLSKVMLQVRGLARPWVCLAPHPGLPNVGAVGSHRADIRDRWVGIGLLGQ